MLTRNCQLGELEYILAGGILEVDVVELSQYFWFPTVLVLPAPHVIKLYKE